MANGIDKKALFKLKSEPYLKPISDLGVGFYNLDENTAILQFQVSNTEGPLLIHENNLTAYAYFESSNGSASNVLDLDIIDSNNGIVQLTVDKDFLQASTSTTVTGQLYISVNNVSGKPEYNEVAVLREFRFEVKDALINKISATTKIEYIRMFDRLKVEIEKRIKDIEDAIANGEDYVAEMKTVLQQGKDALNQLVADGTKEVNDTVTQAVTEVNTTKTDAVNTMTEAKDTMLQAIEDEEIVNTTQLDSKLNGLNWQKWKLTQPSGSVINITGVDFNKPEETMGNTCFAYTMTVTNQPVGTSNYGFAFYQKRDNSTVSHEKITYTPYNSNRIFVRTKSSGTWLDWTEVLTTESDLPGQQYKLTNDDGTRIYIKGLDPKTCEPGFYETSSMVDAPIPGDTGLFYVDVTPSDYGRRLIKATYSAGNRAFVKTVHTDGADKGWRELTFDESSLDWQKYKLTNDDGTYKDLSSADLNNIDFLNTLKVGNYYTPAPKSSPNGASGFLTVIQRSSIKIAYFYPYNEDKVFMNRYYNSWSGWEDMSPGIKSKVLFDGSTNGVGSSIGLTDSIYNYKALVISGSHPGGSFNQLVLTSTIGNYFFFREANLADSDGHFLGFYEAKIDITNGTTLKIANDVSWDEKNATGSGPDRNAFSVLHIEGWK